MIAALRREISDIPLPNEWKITDIVKNKQPEMRSKIRKAEKTFRACIEGISVLSQAYFAIDEREIGCKSAQRLLHELRDAGTGDAEYRACLLTPQNPEDRPEHVWTEFHRVLPELIEVFEPEGDRSQEEMTELDVELLSAEITAVLQASVSQRGSALIDF